MSSSAQGVERRERERRNGALGKNCGINFPPLIKNRERTITSPTSR